MATFLLILGIVGASVFYLIGKPIIKGGTLEKPITIFAYAILGIMSIYGGWNGVMFYAEPAYNYEVRQITGNIKGYTEPGWQVRLFGTVKPWKKAMSVSHGPIDQLDTSLNVSAQLAAARIRMLDRVDGDLYQTTRFRLPADESTFLMMAAEYRTPENLLRTELIPAVEQIITATSSLMSAEEYFNGKRNEFQIDFEDQMRNGAFVIRLDEQKISAPTQRLGTADASLANQERYEEQQQTRFKVEKLKDPETRQYLRSKHNYSKFGISVVTAKATNFMPNAEFETRMRDQQQAAADRMIARETRIQEEEQKQLAIVRGQRQIAEEEAKVQKAQIKQTTEAETAKSLALINSNKELEQAEIQRSTAAIILERDRLTAQSIEVLAAADQYEREARIAGDNALEQRLNAEVAIQELWADAFAKRQVPSQVTVLGGDSSGTVPTGSNTELKQMMQMMTMQMAERLNYERSLHADPASN